MAPRNENGGPQAAVDPRKRRLRAGISQRLDLLRETALVTRGLVLVDDALVRDVVDGRLLGAEHALGRRRVAGGDRLLHFLDRAAQRRAQALVGAALLGRLLGALRGLFGIRHGISLCIPKSACYDT